MARSYTSFMEHGKPPAGRRRESRYPAQITARIAGDVKARLEALADQELVAVGIIVRRAIEAGLPVIEGSAADIARRSAMEDARDWWGGLEQPRAWRVAEAPGAAQGPGTDRGGVEAVAGLVRRCRSPCRHKM